MWPNPSHHISYIKNRISQFKLTSWIHSLIIITYSQKVTLFFLIQILNIKIWRIHISNFPCWGSAPGHRTLKLHLLIFKSSLQTQVSLSLFCLNSSTFHTFRRVGYHNEMESNKSLYYYHKHTCSLVYSSKVFITKQWNDDEFHLFKYLMEQ
jgi:hypothetical protein